MTSLHLRPASYLALYTTTKVEIKIRKSKSKQIFSFLRPLQMYRSAFMIDSYLNVWGPTGKSPSPLIACKFNFVHLLFASLAGCTTRVTNIRYFPLHLNVVVFAAITECNDFFLYTVRMLSYTLRNRFDIIGILLRSTLSLPFDLTSHN